MIKKDTTCCFTGHRATKLPWANNEADPRCAHLKMKIYDAAEAVYTSGVRHYICGMANGCDLYFCQAVIELRQQHDDVTLEAAIPCEGQSEKWDADTRAKYDRLVSECDYHTLVQSKFSDDCMMRRNRYMVDNSNVLIAVCSGMPGGTMNTLLYAMRQGIEIIQLPVE